VVSNRSSDVQKLFLVIRDGSSNIMYKISLKIHYKQRQETNKKTQLEHVKSSLLLFTVESSKNEGKP
jgi:hypothetical protein